MLALLLVPVRAWGNAGTLPDTVDVLIPSADTVHIEASFGLLLETSPGEYHWVCHETMVPGTSSTTPRFFATDNGVLLAAIGGLDIAKDPSESLYRSTDGGCNWSPPSGLTDVVIQDVDVDPTDADHLLASSRTVGSGVSNGVHVSSDGGATWTKTNLDVMDRLFLSVRFSPADPNVVWASAAVYSPSAQGYVYRSTNGGQDFSEPTNPFSFMPEGSEEATIYFEAASPSDALVAYLRVDGLNKDWLLMTDDGGESFSIVLQVDDNIADVAIDDNGDVWVVGQLTGLYRSTDGTSFNPISGAPLIRGLGSDSNGLWLAVSQLSEGYALALTTDAGATYEERFVFKDLNGPVPCEAGSDVTDTCVSLWPALAQQLGINIPTPTDHWPADHWGLNQHPSDPGCTCALGRTRGRWTLGALFVFLCAAAVLARRRTSGTPPDS